MVVINGELLSGSSYDKYIIEDKDIIKIMPIAGGG